MSWPNQQTQGGYYGSMIPGNNQAALLSSPMSRGLWLSVLMSMLGLPAGATGPGGVPTAPGTPPLPPAGAGSGDATAGVAGGAPGTVTPPPPGGVTQSPPSLAAQVPALQAQLAQLQSQINSMPPSAPGTSTSYANWANVNQEPNAGN